MTRRFGARQRAALYLASGGKCAQCGVGLTPGWHADHVTPWSQGGETDIVNGQALCPTCNLKKGAKVDNMTTPQTARPWQTEAWRRYEALQKRDFLCCSCPGAGKTRWALTLARTLLDRRVVERVVIVAPSQNVRDQWVPKTEQDTIVHLTAVDNANGGVEDARDFEGCVVTYAQVAINPDLQRRGCARRTLVIFDEIHHAGDEQTWGERVAYAFEHASYRVGLTGTPWRRPKSGRIPFVAYDATGAIAPEYNYSYGQAVRDEVCRYIQFHVYDAQVQCVELETATAATSTLSDLSDPQDRSQAMTVVLRSDGEWLRTILYEAHQRLLDVRKGNDDESPVVDAQGLAIADDQQHAREVARLLERITGEAPELIISDEPDAKAALDRFRAGSRKWAVAVGMVSEGVDVTPLYVGVYANRRTSPLLFRQIVGRFVRRREGETRDAMLFMPAIPDLMKHASEIENELNQVAAELEGQEREQRDRKPREANSEPVLFAWKGGESELHDIIRSGESYSAREYEVVSAALKQANAFLDPVKFIATARLLGMQLPQLDNPKPTPAQPKEPARVSKDVQKRMLRAKLDKLVKVSAARMGIEVKTLNDHLFRRFGQRSQLSIQQLQEALQYIIELEEEGA